MSLTVASVKIVPKHNTIKCSRFVLYPTKKLSHNLRICKYLRALGSAITSLSDEACAHLKFRSKVLFHKVKLSPTCAVWFSRMAYLEHYKQKLSQALLPLLTYSRSEFKKRKKHLRTYLHSSEYPGSPCKLEDTRTSRRASALCYTVLCFQRTEQSPEDTTHSPNTSRAVRGHSKEAAFPKLLYRKAHCHKPRI